MDEVPREIMCIEKEKKNSVVPLIITPKGPRRKEYLRRLRKSRQHDQMTAKEVKNESTQKEGLFSRVKYYGGGSSKTKTQKGSLDLVTMNSRRWHK